MRGLMHGCSLDIMNLQLIIPLLLFLVILNWSLWLLVLFKELSHPLFDLMPNDNTLLMRTNLPLLYSYTILYIHKMFMLNHIQLLQIMYHRFLILMHKQNSLQIIINSHINKQIRHHLLIHLKVILFDLNHQ